MGGTPVLLNLMLTMFPPQMRQMKTSRAAPDRGICVRELELIVDYYSSREPDSALQQVSEYRSVGVSEYIP
jgi:hypothetical protein